VPRTRAAAGSGFVNGAGLTVTFSGTGITVNSTTFLSATQVKANITIASNAATGARDVTVTNPDAGTKTLTGGFTVNAAPTITTPNSTTPFTLKHNQDGTLVINGTGFQSGLTVTFSGGFTINGTVTVTGSTQITVPVHATNNQGTYSLTVTNPDGGTTVSTGSLVNN
jgi:hypothetical protein